MCRAASRYAPLLGVTRRSGKAYNDLRELHRIPHTRIYFWIFPWPFCGTFYELPRTFHGVPKNRCNLRNTYALRGISGRCPATRTYAKLGGALAGRGAPLGGWALACALKTSFFIALSGSGPPAARACRAGRCFRPNSLQLCAISRYLCSKEDDNCAKTAN